MGPSRNQNQEALLIAAQRDGFVVQPLPLGGYLISLNDAQRTPLVANQEAATPTFYLAPGNFVDLRQPVQHQYSFEV